MRRSRIHVDQLLPGGSLPGGSLPGDSLKGGSLTLRGDAAHYLGTVLRARVGQPVAVFNGRDGEFHGEIAAVRKREVDIVLEPGPVVAPETLLTVHIGLGLSRGERMDYAVQKATELGVTDITPLFTEFSEVKLDAARAQKRTDHWQKIAVSASEQCGRCHVPTIHTPAALSEWVASVRDTTAFLLDHNGAPGFSAAAGRDSSDTESERPDAIALLIGPEGGISENESALALAANFKAVRLGPRILRTETAPVVALTALQLLWGDFGV